MYWKIALIFPFMFSALHTNDYFSLHLLLYQLYICATGRDTMVTQLDVESEWVSEWNKPTGLVPLTLPPTPAVTQTQGRRPWRVQRVTDCGHSPHPRSKKGSSRAALLIPAAEREDNKKGLCELIKHHTTGKLRNYFVLRETEFTSLTHATAGIIFWGKSFKQERIRFHNTISSLSLPLFKYWSIDFSLSFSKSSDSWC